MYPFDGNNVTKQIAETIARVHRNIIPFYLAEYYSINLLYTAKQLAFNLATRFQLFHSYEYSGNKVSGNVLQSMSKKEKKRENQV